MMSHTILQILFSIATYFIEASKSARSSQFVILNECPCQGHNLTYECTVVGNGATVWKVTGVDCSLQDDEIILLQDIEFNYTSQWHQTCSGGAQNLMITGYAIGAENAYISQLNIQVNNIENLIKFNATVVCTHDNGIHTMKIGSIMLNSLSVYATAPLPPPDVAHVETNDTHLSFNWSQVSLNFSCSPIQYHIMANDYCGDCPATTGSNMVTCSGNYTQLASDRPCLFAVQTVVCDDLEGNVSIPVTIPIPDGAKHDSATTDSIGNLRTEGSITTLIISATVIPVMVLIGITFILGIFLVYLILKKSITTQRTPGGANMAELELNTAENNDQVTGIYSYLQPIEDQDQTSSRTTDNSILYADLDPNTAIRNAHQQNLTLLRLDDDCVQYEEIRHEPSAVDKTLVNLDLLLKLLKELTPRWHELGLIVGVPREVMDNYSLLSYPSDQCLIEVLDYWLRYHPGQLKWIEVAQALKEMKLYHLAGKAQQISATGKFSLEGDASNFDIHNLGHKQIPQFNQSDNEFSCSNEIPPMLPHKQWNLGVANGTSTSEYEETSDLLPPPPLPPKIKKLESD